MDWPSLLVGALIGGLLSLAVSYGFYIAASKDLRQHADRLSKQSADLYKLNISLLHLLNNAGAIEIKEFDPQTGAPSKWSVSKEFSTQWTVEENPKEGRDEG